MALGLGREDPRHQAQVEAAQTCWEEPLPWFFKRCRVCDLYFPLPEVRSQRCPLCGGLDIEDVSLSRPWTLIEVARDAATKGEWRP